MRVKTKKGGDKMKKKGFTLIELLVVIAIIGLLSTLAVVALNSARSKARDAKRIADIKQVQTALELYYNDNNEYPIDDGVDGTTLGAEVTCLGSDGFATSCTGTLYMGLVPDNPEPNGVDYLYQSIISSSGNHCTTVGDGCSIYYIGFELEGRTGNLPLGPKCARPSGITDGACPAY